MDNPSVTISVPLPQALLFETGLSKEAASKALLQAFVLSLYRRDRISTGKAAQILGIQRIEFIRLLAQDKTPFLDYTPEELTTESAVLEEWQAK